jgi:hypothetical protein
MPLPIKTRQSLKKLLGQLLSDTSLEPTKRSLLQTSPAEGVPLRKPRNRSQYQVVPAQVNHLALKYPRAKMKKIGQALSHIRQVQNALTTKHDKAGVTNVRIPWPIHARISQSHRVMVQKKDACPSGA